METARSLRHMITRAVGPVSGARRELSAATVRTQAMRGILVPSLVLAALGTVAAASPGHISSGHVHPGVVLTRTCKVGSRPWMYTAPTRGKSRTNSAAISMPWMYSVTISKPWMYTATVGRPWMYSPAFNAVTVGKPWMYKPVAGQPWMYMPWMYMPWMYTARASAACPSGGAPA